MILSLDPRKHPLFTGCIYCGAELPEEGICDDCHEDIENGDQPGFTAANKERQRYKDMEEFEQEMEKLRNNIDNLRELFATL